MTLTWILPLLVPTLLLAQASGINDSNSTLAQTDTLTTSPADGFEIELTDIIDSAAVETVYVTEAGDTIAPESLVQAPLEIEKIPEVLTFIPAIYPSEELKKGVEGTVIMEFIVTDSGMVESLKVVEGITPALDTAALTALQ